MFNKPKHFKKSNNDPKEDVQHWAKGFRNPKEYGLNAAIASGAMMDSRQSAELYTEAAMVIEKLDTDFANEYYSKLLNSKENIAFIQRLS